LGEEEREEKILQNVVINQFGKRALRSIAFAYKDFSHEDWREVISERKL
jgi:hypothetical protein